MHSIERYGIVALLFLVVTVVAVLMWDGGKDKKAKDPASTAASNPAAAARHAPEGDAAERRLSLLAEARPGPLERGARGRRADLAQGAGELSQGLPQSEGLPPTRSATPVATEPVPAPADAPEAGAQAPVTSPARALAPREEPAREEVIGRVTPQAPSGRSYTVKSGDTLSEIAQHELGSSRRWNEIVAANPGLDPARLLVGRAIVIPGAAPATTAAPSVAPGQAKPGLASPTKVADAPAAEASKSTWKVGRGENLWKIAEKTLGDGKRWREIAALNPKVDPDKLLLGQVLVLPASARKASAAPAPQRSSRPGAREDLVASSKPDAAPRRGGKVK